MSKLLDKIDLDISVSMANHCQNLVSMFSVNVDEWLSSVNMDTLGVDEDEDLVRTPSRTSIVTDSSGVRLLCFNIVSKVIS